MLCCNGIGWDYWRSRKGIDENYETERTVERVDCFVGCFWKGKALSHAGKGVFEREGT